MKFAQTFKRWVIRMSNVYLAFYKHKRKVTSLKTLKHRCVDELIKFATKGTHSHVEIAVDNGDGTFDCFSSSAQDGGVRKKTMTLSPERWDLCPINTSREHVEAYFEKTKHQEYDHLGAVASTIPCVQLDGRQFCSEWCFNCIYNSDQGWRFSPADMFWMHNPNNTYNPFTTVSITTISTTTKETP